MALVTCCPGCQAIFHLSTVQLHTCDGEVRCGQCEHIFNGFSALIAVPDSYLVVVTSQSQQSDIESAVPGLSAETGGRSSLVPEPVDHFDVYAEQSPISRSWLTGGIMLLILLLWQFAHAWRTEVIVAWPSTWPVVEKYCDLFNCEIKLPHDLDRLSLEASDLQINPAADPETAMLHVVIRNFASFPQALPSLLLSLTDHDGGIVASRIFAPEEYLAPEQMDQMILLEDNEIQIRCYLDISELSIDGYQLKLLYP